MTQALKDLLRDLVSRLGQASDGVCGLSLSFCSREVGSGAGTSFPGAGGRSLYRCHGGRGTSVQLWTQRL